MQLWFELTASVVSESWRVWMDSAGSAVAQGRRPWAWNRVRQCLPVPEATLQVSRRVGEVRVVSGMTFDKICTLTNDCIWQN